MAHQSDYDPVELERLVDEQVRQRLAALGVEEDKWWMWKAIGYACVLVSLSVALAVSIHLLADWL
ncbi:MAG: hypothetical protein AAFO73_10900 [Pseudomonadota bacterium]